MSELGRRLAVWALGAPGGLLPAGVSLFGRGAVLASDSPPRFQPAQRAVRRARRSAPAFRALLPSGARTWRVSELLADPGAARLAPPEPTGTLASEPEAERGPNPVHDAARPAPHRFGRLGTDLDPPSSATGASTDGAVRTGPGHAARVAPELAPGRSEPVRPPGAGDPGPRDARRAASDALGAAPTLANEAPHGGDAAGSRASAVPGGGEEEPPGGPQHDRPSPAPLGALTPRASDVTHASPVGPGSERVGRSPSTDEPPAMGWSELAARSPSVPPGGVPTPPSGDDAPPAVQERHGAIVADPPAEPQPATTPGDEPTDAAHAAPSPAQHPSAPGSLSTARSPRGSLVRARTDAPAPAPSEADPRSPARPKRPTGTTAPVESVELGARPPAPHQAVAGQAATSHDAPQVADRRLTEAAATRPASLPTPSRRAETPEVASAQASAQVAAARSDLPPAAAPRTASPRSDSPEDAARSPAISPWASQVAPARHTAAGQSRSGGSERGRRQSAGAPGEPAAPAHRAEPTNASEPRVEGRATVTGGGAPGRGESAVGARPVAAPSAAHRGSPGTSEAGSSRRAGRAPVVAPEPGVVGTPRAAGRALVVAAEHGVVGAPRAVADEPEVAGAPRAVGRGTVIADGSGLAGAPRVVGRAPVVADRPGVVGGPRAAGRAPVAADGPGVAGGPRAGVLSPAGRPVADVGARTEASGHASAERRRLEATAVVARSRGAPGAAWASVETTPHDSAASGSPHVAKAERQPRGDAWSGPLEHASQSRPSARPASADGTPPQRGVSSPGASRAAEARAPAASSSRGFPGAEHGAEPGRAASAQATRPARALEVGSDHARAPQGSAPRLAPVGAGAQRGPLLPSADGLEPAVRARPAPEPVRSLRGVVITIGRVEVHPEEPLAPVRRDVHRPGRSLDDYLRARGRRR